MSYDNTNTGLMYRNERRQNDRQPEFTGTVNVDGVEYWLSGWVKEGKPGGKLEGKRFFSLSLKAKDAPPMAAPAPARAQTKTGTAFDDMEDDVPF